MSLCLTQDKEQRENYKTLMKGVIAKLSKNKFAEAMELNTMENFEFLWEKYTGKPFDPVTVKIEKSDINLMNLGYKEWASGLGNRAGVFKSNFFIPKAILRNIKGGQKFITELGEAVSYNQRQVKEGSKHIDVIIQNMYKMMGEQGMSKDSYKDFAKLEQILMRAEPGEMKNAALNNLMKYLGEKGADNQTVAGKTMRRFQKLLTMEAIPKTESERAIVTEWNILRSESMKNLLNGAIAARRTIETLTDSGQRKHLMKAYDKIQEQIEALLIKSDSNDLVLSNLYKEKEGIFIPNDKNAYTVLDPKTKKEVPYVTLSGDSGKKVVGIKQYSPKYVIELSNIMDNLVAYAKSSNKENWNNASAAEIEATIIRELSPDAISNRLKQAGETEKYHSLDPVYYLNKYVHDVASFNMRSRINHSFSNVSKELVKAIRNNNVNNGKADVGEYARHLFNTIREIKDTALMNNGGTKATMDNYVRIINGFEYISKLGWSVKGGLKNRMQSLFNWVYFGQRGYREKKRFLNTTSREFEKGEAQVDNAGMVSRQLKRFGMLMGEKKEAANIAAATGGSIDVQLVPKGFETNKMGQLVLSGSGETGSKKVADAVSKITEKAAVTMQWAENANRIGTFEMAFSLSFLAEKRRIDYHIKKLTEKNNGKAPSKSQLYDHIEKIAGNTALEMVKTIHYDYDNWAKARILQTKPGKIIGQYQHFKFAFFDMQYNLIRDAARDVKAFKFTEKNPITGQAQVSENLSRGMRFAALYTLIPGLAALAFDVDIGGAFSAFGISPFAEEKKSKGDKSSTGGLIENPMIEEAAKLLDYFGNAPDGTEQERNAHFNAYFGKGPIRGNLGPFASDIITAGELFDWWNLTSEDYAEHRNLNYDPNDPKWWYNVARIFSIQGARSAWHTIPALLNKDWGRAIQVETGMYSPKWLTKTRKEKVLPWVQDKIYDGKILPKLKLSKKKSKTNDINKNALKALRGF